MKMTIDLSKIKSDAEKIAANSDLLLMALPVKDVLGMLAEIEKLEAHKQSLIDLRVTHGFDSWAAALCEIDRLNSENEALKKRVEELSPFRGAPLSGQSNRCLACGGFHYGLSGLPCPIMKVTAL